MFSFSYFPLGRFVVLVLIIKMMKEGARTTGFTTTRWLLRGLLLLDAGVLAGSGLAKWALPVVGLLVPNMLGAWLLFRKPREAAKEAKEV